jgi:hypothetical protein
MDKALYFRTTDNDDCFADRQSAIVDVFGAPGVEIARQTIEKVFGRTFEKIEGPFEDTDGTYIFK